MRMYNYVVSYNIIKLPLLLGKLWSGHLGLRQFYFVIKLNSTTPIEN